MNSSSVVCSRQSLPGSTQQPQRLWSLSGQQGVLHPDHGLGPLLLGWSFRCGVEWHRHLSDRVGQLRTEGNRTVGTAGPECWSGGALHLLFESRYLTLLIPGTPQPSAPPPRSSTSLPRPRDSFLHLCSFSELGAFSVSPSFSGLTEKLGLHQDSSHGFITSVIY